MLNLDYFLNLLDSKLVISCLIALFIILIVNRISIRNINKKRIDKTQKLLLIKSINNYTKYLIVFFIFIFSFYQLQGMLVSILAVAAAIVLATKEIIMCFTGGTLLKSASYFKLGDRIEINNIRGFVIETGLMATKVLEIGPEKNSQQTTGNIISFPNSLVFSNVLKNESYFKNFSIKSYFFLVEDRERLGDLESFLLKKGEEIVSSYLAEAKKSISAFCEKEAIAIPSIEPRTKLLIEEENEMKVLLKMPVRNNEIGDVEQTLNRAYVNFLSNK